MTAPEDIYYWHPCSPEYPGAVRKGDGMHYVSTCAAEKPRTVLSAIPAEIRDPGLRAISDRTKAVTGSADWKQNAALLVQRAVERQQDQSAHETRHRRVVTRVPEEYWEHLDRPEPRAALLNAQEFMASDKQLLVLAGEGGVGKSFAAAWCVDQGGTGAEFIQSGEMAQHGSYDPIFWRGLAERSVLAVNELGQERSDAAGWFAGAFCDLLDRRISGKKRTVFTTNVPGARFMARYAEGDFLRLARRWKEYGRFVIAPPYHREVGEDG